jgi:predicted MFS family arabinose efflux permease
VAGPGLAGLLISIVGAASAVILDALSFLGSAILIRAAPPASRPASFATAGGSIRAELVDGLRVLRREPVLIRMTLAGGISNFGLMAARAVLLLHLYRDLGLTPALVGLVLAAPGFASIAGVAAANAVTRRLGVGRALLAATILEAAVWLAVPVATGPTAPIQIAVALGFSSFWGLVWNVVALSVRQVVVPPEIQGRVAAIRGAIGFGVIPLGSVAGGLLGEALTNASVPAALPLTIAAGAIVGVASGLPLMGPSMTAVRRWRFGEPWPAA